MTTSELKSAVSSFCYIDIAEKDLRFICYANLALRTVFNEICVIGEHKIRLGEKPLCYTEKLLHKGGVTTTMRLSGKSYSMLLSGKGTVTITDSNGAKRKSFDTEETAFCGFLSGEATLTLEGDEDFCILHLSSFKQNFGTDIGRIPILTNTTSFSMRQLVGDFQCFIDLPTDKDGNPISDAILIDDKLIVNGRFFGEINVRYKRLPKRILADFPDEKIDIPQDSEDLLGVLCAYFILLEEEKDRAEHFKELYNNILNIRKKNLCERTVGKYADTNGWA